MKQQLTQILQDTFGLEAFRPGQEETISHIVSGEDTLVFMPTGGGKSLTYQLPAMYREGLCIVVSPLISLMKDQVDKLRALGIRAEMLNSTLDAREKQDILYELSLLSGNPDSGIKFIYVAPERLMSTDFLSALHGVKISLLAIDEAHCISQWGHDFRPSYMRILDFISRISGTDRSFPIVGLTATATQKVRKDIVERLGLVKYRECISGFDRKNIILVVREISKKEEKQQKVLEIIEKTPGTGIIYCSSRKHVVELADFLIASGVKTGVYKGDLSADAREAQQNAFMNDEYKVMVATNAFGMGIDKKDIRFVVHYNLPGSIENYYQEVGRAGRDGKMSYGIVLASYGDTKIQEFFIDNTYPDKKSIETLYNYIYRNFELGEGAGKILEKTYMVIASESGLNNDMLVGSSLKVLEKYRVLERGLGDSQGSGNFRGRGIRLLEGKRHFHALAIDWSRQDYLKDESHFKLDQMKRLLFYPSCRKRFILEYFGDAEDLKTLSDNCGLCDYCLESKKFQGENVSKAIPTSSYSLILETVKKYHEKFGQTLLVGVLLGSGEKRISDWNLDLYEHFAALQEYSKEAITAMFEALLMENFIYKSQGEYPKLGITELGGAAIYRNHYINDYISDLNGFVIRKVGNNLRQTQKSANKKPSSRQRKGETYTETLQLYLAGKSLGEISKMRKLSLQTIESHIISLYESGELALAMMMNFVELDIAKQVKSFLKEGGGLKDIKQSFEALGNSSVSYFEIKVARAMCEKGDL